MATVNTCLTVVGSYGWANRRLLVLILWNVELQLLLKVWRQPRKLLQTQKNKMCCHIPLNWQELLNAVPWILVWQSRRACGIPIFSFSQCCFRDSFNRTNEPLFPMLLSVPEISLKISLLNYLGEFALTRLDTSTLKKLYIYIYIYTHTHKYIYTHTHIYIKFKYMKQYYFCNKIKYFVTNLSKKTRVQVCCVFSLAGSSACLSRS